jgi:hypothetical protein
MIQRPPNVARHLQANLLLIPLPADDAANARASGSHRGHVRHTCTQAARLSASLSGFAVVVDLSRQSAALLSLLVDFGDHMAPLVTTAWHFLRKT